MGTLAVTPLPLGCNLENSCRLHRSRFSCSIALPIRREVCPRRKFHEYRQRLHDGPLEQGSWCDNSSMGFGLDAASLLGAKTPGAFYVEVLKSRSVQDRLINRFDLRARYGKSTYFEARKKLAKFTDIEEDKKSGVITLTVTDYEPKMAAQIANAYVDELNRLAVDLNTSSAHRERQFLEERLTTAKQDLARASAALSQFTTKNSMVDPQNEGRAVMDAAARMQGELIASETELKGLQQIYSDDNVRVRTLKARIAELQSQIKKLVGLSNVGQNIVGQNNDPSAQESVGGWLAPYPSMHTLPGLGSRYADLYREAKIQEAVYAFVTQQFEMAKIQEAKELPIVRVMDAGVTPEKRSSPIRSLIVAGSVFRRISSGVPVGRGRDIAGSRFQRTILTGCWPLMLQGNSALSFQSCGPEPARCRCWQNSE